MAKLYVLIFAVLCFSTCDCAVDRVRKLDNGTLEFPPITEVDVSSTLTSKFDGKGLEPWYDVAKSFVHTVQKDDLPYDDIEKMKDGDFKVEEFLKGWEMPFLVTFAIGLLFAIIVPIVGFCFCCCRCCGKCGGEMVQKFNSKSRCKRHVYGISLSIITLLMFVGCLLAFVSNDRITDTVESYKATPISAIRDSEQYFNQTLNVVTDTIINTVVDVLDIIVVDVKNLPNQIANEINKKLADKVVKPLKDVVKLGEDTERMGELLDDISRTTNELQSRFKNLTDDIDKVNRDLSSTNYSSETITTGANFSALPDVQEQLGNINDINNNDLKGKAEEGLNTFNKINDTIAEKSESPTNEVRNETEKAKKEFRGNIQKDVVEKVEKEVLNKTDGWVKDIEDAFEDQVKPYDKYRYYAGVGLTCLILIPVVLLALGLLCGIFGYDKDLGPTERGAISNMGGNCLMAAVGFMFIFVFFLMIFTAICFILGSHLEKGCYSLREETLYSDFLDNPKFWDGDYILAKELYSNGSIKLKIGTILSSCRKNDPIYQAIQGKNKWDLNSKFSVRDKLGDIEGHLDDLNVSIENEPVLNQETKDGLKNLTDSGVDDIDFEKFFNETGKDIVNDTQIDSLQAKLNATGNASIARDLEAIQIEAKAMKDLSNNLNKSVTELQQLGSNIKIDANNTLKEAEKAESTYSSDVTKVVSESVDKFSNEILGYIDQTSAWAVKAVGTDLGRCRILTDVYDAVVNLVCRDTIYPFNGYWFSIGFCLFFYIPAIILGVKLAKHYRRMKFEEGFDRGFDRHDTVEMRSVGERNKVWNSQGNSVFPK